MKIKSTEIAPHVYHVVFSSQRELASTLMRFQEFYESPKFKGKIFSRKEFMDWYKEEHGRGKRFTYFDDWSGFNLPDYIFDLFIDGKFDPLSTQERQFLALIKKIPKPFYIIATGADEPSEKTINHELAHAMWYLNKTYRKQAKQTVRKLNKKTLSAIRTVLERRGYNKSVFDDETHAYLISDLRIMKFFVDFFGGDLLANRKTILRIRELFVKYSRRPLSSFIESPK